MIKHSEKLKHKRCGLHLPVGCRARGLRRILGAVNL